MNLLFRILAFLFGGFVLMAYLRSLGQDHSLSFHAFFCSFILFMFWSVWHLSKTKHIKPEDRKRWLSDTASISPEEAASFMSNWYIRIFLGFRPPLALLVLLTAFYLCPWDLLYQTSIVGALIENIQPPSTENLLRLEFGTYAVPFVSVFNMLMGISLILAFVYSNPMPAYVNGRVKSPYLKLFFCALGSALLVAMALFSVSFNLTLEGTWSRGIFNVVKSHKWAFALYIYAAWYFCHTLALCFFCFMKTFYFLRKNSASIPRR